MGVTSCLQFTQSIISPFIPRVIRIIRAFNLVAFLAQLTADGVEVWVEPAYRRG
jgi:hypothetical protein